MVVGDMEATVAFYRRLGLTVEVAPGGAHAAARMPNGLSLEFDTHDFVPQWDSGWNGGTGGSTVLGFGVASREAVDEIYADLTGAGYRAHQSRTTPSGEPATRSWTIQTATASGS
jgi:catechol 2,3-dioxygenase-like lactoylglutathione lyase family enzyme